jgi:protein phosphatase
MKITFRARSDVGHEKTSNQDSYRANDEVDLYVVADGTGGSAAGDIASRTAVEAIEEFIKLTSNEDEISWPYGLDENLSLNANRLKTAARFANWKVIKKSRETPTYSGMSTTVVALLVEEETADIAHVGDSRAYLIRDDNLRCLTRDHSLVYELVSSGSMDIEQARNYPLRHVITRALGAKRDVEVEMQTLQLRDKDLLLLCSDGLNAMLRDQDILEIVMKDRPDLGQMVTDLVDAANRAGGEDNITVVSLAFQQD